MQVGQLLKPKAPGAVAAVATRAEGTTAAEGEEEEKEEEEELPGKESHGALVEYSAPGKRGPLPPSCCCGSSRHCCCPA